MRILFGAQSCGFGPVSKAVAVARAFPGQRRVFAGDGFVSAFARSNDGVFDEVHEVSGAGTTSAFADQVSRSDWVISVMNADLVLMAVAAGRPVTMVDSLFSFWQHERSLEEIAKVVTSAPRRGYGELKEHLAGLRPHEEILAAHMLADSSLLQNFPGVGQRAAEVDCLCDTNFHITGSIIDEAGLADVHSDAGAEPFDIVINLGGFKNFFLDFDMNNSYLLLLEGWVRQLLSDWPSLDRVLVCGGAFWGNRAKELSVAGRLAIFDCLPQRKFMRIVAATPHYLMAPGLTALHEAVLMEQLPMALPEQHYGHVANMRLLNGTTFQRIGTSLDVSGLDYPLVEDDFEGTRCIAAQARRLLEDPAARQRFYGTLSAAFNAYLDISAPQRSQAVHELRSLFGGLPLAQVLVVLADSVDVNRG